MSKYTQEEINKRFNGEDPDEINKTLADYEQSAKSYLATQRDEIQRYRALVYGDEYSKRSEFMPDSDRIMTRQGKALVDFVVAAVFDQPLGAEIKADNLPYISEQLAQELMKFAPTLGIKIEPAAMDQAVAELVGELFTHQFDTYKRESKLIDRLKRATEYALVDRCALLKDTVDPLGRYMLKADVVTLDSFAADPYAPDWCDLQWARHDIPIRQEEFAVKYPWVVEALKRKNLITSVKDLFERYFGNKKDDQGQIWPSTADKANGKRAPIVIQEWWIKDYETVEDPLYFDAMGQVTKDPAQAAIGQDGQPASAGKAPPRYKYPGQWKRVYRYQNEVLEVSPNPFPHKELPFTLIRPKSKANDWRGCSWIYDLHDILVNLNKMASMASQNVVDTCNTLRIVNPDAFENAKVLKDKNAGVKELVLKPDRTFDEGIFQPPPVPINQSVFEVANYFDAKLVQVAGTGDTTQQVTKNGEQQQVQGVNFAVRNTLDQVKAAIENIALHYIYNGAEFINQDRSFALTDMQTVTVRMNPAMMQAITGSLEARFSVVATQSEPLPTDPKLRIAAIVDLSKGSAELAATTGIPLSAAIASLKPPGYQSILRIIRRAEMQPKQPSPEEQEQMNTRENATQQTLKDIFEEAEKTIGKESVPNALVILDQYAMGKTRAILDSGLTGQPNPVALQAVAELKASVSEVPSSTPTTVNRQLGAVN